MQRQSIFLIVAIENTILNVPSLDFYGLCQPPNFGPQVIYSGYGIIQLSLIYIR